MMAISEYSFIPAWYMGSVYEYDQRVHTSLPVSSRYVKQSLFRHVSRVYLYSN
jgi:hypothetical protein